MLFVCRMNIQQSLLRLQNLWTRPVVIQANEIPRYYFSSIIRHYDAYATQPSLDDAQQLHKMGRRCLLALFRLNCFLYCAHSWKWRGIIYHCRLGFIREISQCPNYILPILNEMSYFEIKIVNKFCKVHFMFCLVFHILSIISVIIKK